MSLYNWIRLATKHKLRKKKGFPANDENFDAETDEKNEA